VQARHDIRFSSQMDRVKCKPWGLEGGLSASGNSVAISRFGADKETHFPNGKALNQVLKPGDAYILRSGGGGGFGSPLERDLDMLEADVRNEYVSRQSAERLYGAVFKEDGSIDRDLTARNRDQMRTLGLPVDQPIAESAVPPPKPPDEDSAMSLPKLTEEERVAFAMTCRCCS